MLLSKKSKLKIEEIVFLLRTERLISLKFPRAIQKSEDFAKFAGSYSPHLPMFRQRTWWFYKFHDDLSSCRERFVSLHRFNFILNARIILSCLMMIFCNRSFVRVRKSSGSSSEVGLAFYPFFVKVNKKVGWNRLQWTLSKFTRENNSMKKSRALQILMVNAFNFCKVYGRLLKEIVTQGRLHT